MLPQAQQIIAIVGAVLTALGGITGVDISKITPIILKVNALLAALSALTPPTNLDAIIQDVLTAIAALKGANVLPDNTVLDEAVGVITKFTAAEADFKSGQVAIIDDNFSPFGSEYPGVLAAFTKTGATAELLGM